MFYCSDQCVNQKIVRLWIFRKNCFDLLKFDLLTPTRKIQLQPIYQPIDGFVSSFLKTKTYCFERCTLQFQLNRLQIEIILKTLIYQKKRFFFLFDILLLRRSHLTFLCTFGIPSSYSVCLSFVGFVQLLVFLLFVFFISSVWFLSFSVFIYLYSVFLFICLFYSELFVFKTSWFL
jgi:hypothetical protein